MEKVDAHPIQLTPGTPDEQRGICSKCRRPVLDPVHTVVREIRLRGVAKPTKVG